MDRSEHALFGEVRAAFQNQEWLRDVVKFRSIVEEGYYLLPEDYKGYIRTNLERVPAQYRLMTLEDADVTMINNCMFQESDEPLDFSLLYVRGLDLSLFTWYERHKLYEAFQLFRHMLAGNLNTKMQKYLHREYNNSGSLADTYFKSPLEYIKLPKHESTMEYSALAQMIPHVFHFGQLKHIVLYEATIRANLVQTIPEWDYHRHETEFPLSCFGTQQKETCPKVVSILIENPQDFLRSLRQNPGSIYVGIQGYMRYNEPWDQDRLSYSLVLPGNIPPTEEVAIRKEYERVLQNIRADYHTCHGVKVSLTSHTW